MNTEDSEFERIEREQAMRGVPDPIHHTDTSESLEYITGWNDCRQAMLTEQPAPVPWSQALEAVWAEEDDPIGTAQDGLIAEQAAQAQPAQRTWVGLTDEEAESVIDEIPGFAFGLDDGNLASGCVVLYAKAIEAKLKEKNT